MLAVLLYSREFYYIALIIPPSPVLYQYDAFEKEFSFTQLIDDKQNEETLDSFSIYTGEYVLYLTVPENKKIMIDSNIYYEYID